MGAIDELLAFRRLLDGGRSIADVAARFGVTEAVVNRRLALARVSPVLLEEYRSGAMNLEVLQAFTLTDDQNIQDTVWNELQPWDRNARAIRQMLSGGSIPATEKRVKFVCLSAYEQAGGLVRRDLFAEGDQGVLVEDPAKLNRLVSEKLQTLAEGVQAEGWKWIEIQPEVNHQSVSRFRRIHAPAIPFTEKVQAKLSALEQRRDSMMQQLGVGEAEDDFDPQPLYDQIDEVEKRIEEIRRTQKRAYPEDVKAACGVVLSVGQNGEPEFIYGLLRKEDEAALAAATASTQQAESTGSAEPSPAEAEAPAYSATLVESLTQHKTAAIAVELTAQPSIALAALVHALVLSEFALDLHLYRAKSSLHVSMSQAHLDGAAGSLAVVSLEEQHQGWLKLLPRDASDLWRWCFSCDQSTLLQLMAYCLARSLNGVQSKNDNDRERLQHADALAVALCVNMTKWFTPTAENFFGRVSKHRIAEALEEAGKPASAVTLAFKKAELAAVAEKEIRGTGWLPEPVRIVGDVRHAV